MFNLIMHSIPWTPGRETMSLSRLFEYTEDAVADQFRNGATPLLDKLTKLPCLFMEEGVRDEIARVGHITSARVSGGDIVFDFVFDPDASALRNSVIKANQLDFDMPRDFEFSRNHWAVKDVDLYQTLLRHFQPRRQRPSVFTIPEHENIEPVLMSAMMPFEGSFDPVYQTLREAAESVGLRCRRADDIWENAAVIQDVVGLIDRSRVVGCDCTDRNPNVFYEIGIAHTLGREVVLITQNEADIPFDLRHLRYVRYLNNAEGRAELAAALGKRLRSVLGLGD